MYELHIVTFTVTILGGVLPRGEIDQHYSCRVVKFNTTEGKSWGPHVPMVAYDKVVQTSAVVLPQTQTQS